MSATAEITTHRYETAASRGPARSTVPPQGIGVLADACGGLFWGWARPEAAVIERLSRGVPHTLPAAYRMAA